MTPKDTLAMRLRELRKARDWKQKDLALRSGVSHGYIARLEIAMQTPSLTVLEKLAAAFGITVGELLAERPKPPKRRRKRTRP